MIQTAREALTRERIKHYRYLMHNHLPKNWMSVKQHNEEAAEIDALCDMALRSLGTPSGEQNAADETPAHAASSSAVEAIKRLRLPPGHDGPVRLRFNEMLDEIFIPLAKRTDAAEQQVRELEQRGMAREITAWIEQIRQLERELSEAREKLEEYSKRGEKWGFSISEELRLQLEGENEWKQRATVAEQKLERRDALLREVFGEFAKRHIRATDLQERIQKELDHA